MQLALLHSQVWLLALHSGSVPLQGLTLVLTQSPMALQLSVPSHMLPLSQEPTLHASHRPRPSLQKGRDTGQGFPGDTQWPLTQVSAPSHMIPLLQPAPSATTE